MMDRDNITRTGARAPGVERKTARMEVLSRPIVPDTEQEIAVAVASTKGEGKPGSGEGLA